MLDCAVFGVPDAAWGEAAVAAVRLRAGARAGPEELAAWVAERLASYERLRAAAAGRQVDPATATPRCA